MQCLKCSILRSSSTVSKHMSRLLIVVVEFVLTLVHYMPKLFTAITLHFAFVFGLSLSCMNYLQGIRYLIMQFNDTLSDTLLFFTKELNKLITYPRMERDFYTSNGHE